METIQAREEDMLRRARRRVGRGAVHPGPRQPRGPTGSRSSRSSCAAPRGGYLHHNFVVALLNDLFGIQTRGGCSCAGPYGHRLLGIDLERSHEFEREIAGGCEGIKPGWVRVNFNYFVDEEVFAYLVEAVRLVARDGWRLLGDYRFDPSTGLWHHRGGTVEPPLRLADVTYDGEGAMSYPHHGTTAPVAALAGYLDLGRQILTAATPPDLAAAHVSDDFDQLLWFELPRESYAP